MMDEKIREYIDKQKSPQKEICKKLHSIIIKTFPSINNKMKLGVPMYEDKYYIVALKDHVNLGFSMKGLTKEQIGLFSGSGKTMKVIEINSLKDIDQKKIIKLLKMIN